MAKFVYFCNIINTLIPGDMITGLICGLRPANGAAYRLHWYDSGQVKSRILLQQKESRTHNDTAIEPILGIFSSQNIAIGYNIVGLAVAMVISTMHEKIMHRFAQCTEIFKKLQNSVIHISLNHNDENEFLKLS